MLRSSKIIIKAIVPLALMAIIAAGLMAYAMMNLDALAKQTRTIVDVQAVRLERILSLRSHINELAIQSRNLVLETRSEEMAGYKARYDAAMKATKEATETLIALADTPERKSTNLTLKGILEEFYAAQDRATALGLKNDNDGATKALLIDASAPRKKMREFVQARVDVLNAELRQARDDAEQAVTKAQWVLIGASLAGLVGAVLLSAVIVIFGITRPLGSLVGVLQRMARGEVDAEIREAARGDEIGAVGQAVEGIKAMVARKAAEEAEVKRRADAAAAAERRRTMVELADGFERAVGGIVGMVSSSATELQPPPSR